MARSRILLLLAALLLGPAADPAWAVKCLDDAGDAAQVAAARTAVDAMCRCFAFAKPGDYVRCVGDVLAERAAMTLLRNECKGPVKRMYANSVCGREIARVGNKNGPRTPCVSQVISTGKLSCTMRPAGVCNSSFSQVRNRCFAHTHCLDAADTNGDFEIAPPGDTGECTALPDTFTDNGDGTITDSRTALMWEKLSDDGSIHDWDDTYTWSDAFAVKIAALNSGGGFAGYTDWRVPTIHELRTLLRPAASPAVPPDFHTGCAPGCTVLTCSCTSTRFYWSATETVAENSLHDYAAGIGFGSSKELKTFPSRIRAVRGPS
jgi:hypothetical protein